MGRLKADICAYTCISSMRIWIILAAPYTVGQMIVQMSGNRRALQERNKLYKDGAVIS